MYSNRVKRGAGLMALVLLAFGLAGCGSEPAPVVQPPAPPPAPPPFQPQPVEVALGEHGGTVTLMTAEGGGYTLNGEAFAGGEVEAENGSKYLLALEDDKWTAVFQMADGIEVMLGDHGGTVTITKAEDGTYWIGDMGIESGGTVAAENGNIVHPHHDHGRRGEHHVVGHVCAHGGHGDGCQLGPRDRGDARGGRHLDGRASADAGDSHADRRRHDHGRAQHLHAVERRRGQLDGHLCDAGSGVGDAGHARWDRDAAAGRGRQLVVRRGRVHGRRHADGRQRPVLHPHDGRRRHVDGHA